MDNITVYSKHLYTNNSYDYLPGYIFEYDITSAGINILYEGGYISDSEYELMGKMNKQQRTVTEGLLIRKHKELGKYKMEGLIRFRKEFMEANNLVDTDILAIKSDAIFVIGKPCYKLEFGENNLIKFRLDKTFTSFMIVNRIEVYGDPANNILEVKGINKDVLPLHDGYMKSFILDVMRRLENNSRKRVIKFLFEFARKYREFELDYNYYREFNNISRFTMKSDLFNNQYVLKYEDIDEGNISNIDISYNYVNVILEIIRAII